MALIICPNCSKEISDKAVSCPKCGHQNNQPAPSANETERKAEKAIYSGTASDFKFGTLLKAEGNNFYQSKRKRRRRFGSIERRAEMRREGKAESLDISTKTHSVAANRRIDITKGRLTKMWFLGIFGSLGLHYFSAGRYISGSLRFFWGALMWFVSIAVALEIGPRILIFFLSILFLPSLDIIFIRLGKFRDVFRNNII